MISVSSFPFLFMASLRPPVGARRAVTRQVMMSSELPFMLGGGFLELPASLLLAIGIAAVWEPIRQCSLFSSWAASTSRAPDEFDTFVGAEPHRETARGLGMSSEWHAVQCLPGHSADMLHLSVFCLGSESCCNCDCMP